MTGPEVTTELLPGQELHDLLAAARSRPGLAPATLLGRPALMVTRYEDLKSFMVDEASFPGGPIYQFQVEPAVGRTFISMDGDEHLAVRRQAMPAFRSGPVSHFIDEQLVPLAHEVVDRFADRGEADLVAELAQVLPYWAISRKLGLPVGSEDRQRAVTRALLAHVADPHGAARAAAAIDDVVRPVMDERRHEPQDDVLSQLIAAGMDDQQVLSHVRLLYAVGATTTSDAMSNLFFHVLTRPEVQGADVTKLVNETLRMEPPVALLPRLATQDAAVGDTAVPAGTLLLAALAGGNRDPEVFAAPDRFDPERQDSEVLSFGVGPKFCPGWNLARSQLAAALTVVLERLPRLTLSSAQEPVGCVLRATPSVVVRWR
ncbi:MAG: cytochrome monooxygenase [Frankiales bacterium]|nr:cytochrome monooxygenase [Frankiales bacterium]